MCSAARASGMNVPSPLRNCLEPDNIAGTEAVVDHMRKNHLQFLSHEFGPFRPFLSSSEILYITVIRNPWDRILSAMHHALCQKNLADAVVQTKNRGCTFNVATATASDIIMDKCFPRQFSSRDFYVNMFADCPHKICKPVHLARSVNRSKLLSAIIVTDSSESFRRFSFFPLLVHVLVTNGMIYILDHFRCYQPKLQFDIWMTCGPDRTNTVMRATHCGR